jgi:glutamyl-Q tRNA(Asp) synthetase
MHATTSPSATEASPGRPYVGRFAPSPTGPLHAGSAVAALASWLDARAHGGRWLVRIEDVDTPRCVSGAAEEILRQLAALGLVSDETPLWQSRRGPAYAEALQRLVSDGMAYPCACTRAQIDEANAARGHVAVRHAERVYPGTCRPENGGLHGRAPRAWRLRVDDAACTHWSDRRLGAQSQRVAHDVGDFVLQRADGLWAYQLAVVVDDGAQRITDVVRGEDLADNTARQCLLQSALGLDRPRYLHVPLVVGADGEKLSKQHGAPALDVGQPLLALRAAARALGLPPAAPSATAPDALAGWTAAWSALHRSAV